MKNNYEIFSGDDLKIADRIQHLRLLLLIHSCLYYEMNTNLATDSKWDAWAKELKRLQEVNGEISKKVMLYKYFKDWDASTGAFLPIKNRWVVEKAYRFTTGAYKSDGRKRDIFMKHW